MCWRETKKQNTMKIFILLCLMFVSKGHSSLQPSKILAYANVDFKIFISTIFCSIGQHTGYGASNLLKLCSQLHDLGMKFPYNGPFKDPTDKAAAKSLDYLCNRPANNLDDLSKRLIKFCQNESQTTISAMTTSSTSTLAPTTQSTSTLAPSTSTLAPTTLRTSTLSPSTSTRVPTTIKTSTRVPTTTQRTTTKKAKSKPGCTQSYIDECKDDCKKKSEFTLNLGGECQLSRGGYRSCVCKPIPDCVPYKNATCERECEVGRKRSICHIPEAGFTCVCRVIAGSGIYYRLPKQDA